MAGSYPDVPGYKFAYDIDGSIVVVHEILPSNNFTLTSAQTRALNSDKSITQYLELNYSSSRFVSIIFPEERTITGLLFNREDGTGVNAESSSDSTDGLDGTWTEFTGFTFLKYATKATLRQSIYTTNRSGVKSVRFQLSGSGSGRIYNAHLYGFIAPIASPDRLRIVDMTSTSTLADGTTPSGEDIVAQMDFGNIPQRNSVTRQFKVVNNSSSKTASSITVSLDAPSDASPSIVGQYQVSTDNTAFANAINVGTLAPGATTGTLYLRNSVANNAQLSLWSARIIAHPTSWS